MGGGVESKVIGNRSMLFRHAHLTTARRPLLLCLVVESWSRFAVRHSEQEITVKVKSALHFIST